MPDNKNPRVHAEILPALAAAVVFVGDQFPMPCQQRFRRYDRGHLRQKSATEPFRLGRQTAALIVIEPKPLAAELFLKDPILFAKIVEGELLLLIHPSSNGDQQKPEWVENSLCLQNPLSPAWATVGAPVDSCRSSFRRKRQRLVSSGA